MTFQAYFWNFSINFFTILSVMPGQAASATAILFSSSSIAWFLLALFSSCCLSWERSIAITFKITKLLKIDSQILWVCTYFSKCRCDYHRQTAQGLYKILLLWTNIIDYTHGIKIIIMIISSCLNPTLGDEEKADLPSFTPSQARPHCSLGLLFPSLLSLVHRLGC